jgi:hypothetical protein
MRDVGKAVDLGGDVVADEQGVAVPCGTARIAFSRASWISYEFPPLQCLSDMKSSIPPV